MPVRCHDCDEDGVAKVNCSTVHIDKHPEAGCGGDGVDWCGFATKRGVLYL